MTTQDRTAQAVHQAILNVQRELCETGIAKAGHNKEQNFKFRGIDDVLKALSPLLVKHGLYVTPRVVEHKSSTHVNAKGTLWTTAIVVAEFTLRSVIDGSAIVGGGVGEGRDSADKATSKAMSIAYKYWAIQQFSIPTQGVLIDGDASSPEVHEDGGQRAGSALSSDQLTLQDTLESLSRDKAEFLAAASKEMNVRLRSIADIPDDWCRYFIDSLNTPA